jgi:hypothetical protein
MLNLHSFIIFNNLLLNVSLKLKDGSYIFVKILNNNHKINTFNKYYIKLLKKIKKLINSLLSSKSAHKSHSLLKIPPPVNKITHILC